MPSSNRAALVLDTHVWIWLFEGHKKIDTPAVRAMMDEAASDGRLYVPSIALWELAMLEERGRLTLAMDIHTWIDRALSFPGHHLAPLSAQIAVDSSRLPGDFHGDPADRIIAATARALHARLVTADRDIIRYARSRHLHVLAV